MVSLPRRLNKATLDRLYRLYNRREYVAPDPLQFLYDYPAVRDREIVAFLASALAYGRVGQILKSVESLLSVLGPSPFDFVMSTSAEKMKRQLSFFRHRFTSGMEVCSCLLRMKAVIGRFGSLESCFCSGYDPSSADLSRAVASFADNLRGSAHSLVPCVEKGSACKRLNLFLRWMVRKDEVDPGGWKNIPASRLIVPLDTHMGNIAAQHGLTARRSRDMRMALEVTAAFRAMSPDDPVKYDFALTRFGIRSDMRIGFLEE